MTPQETEAILTLSLMAAFADGVKNETERTELKRLATSLPKLETAPAVLYQRVLLKQASMRETAATLQTPELRLLA